MFEKDVPGKRIGNETSDIIPESARLKPLRDTIILEPLEWEPSKIIRIAYTGKPLRGIVKAIGPGSYPKRYDGPRGKRSKSWDSKAFLPTEVKVGDTVELGGMDLGTGQFRGYSFQSFLWGAKEHIICSERDVTGIVSD